MKAISLWQPWATLMAVHAKTIETRSWPTTFSGLLAIHAAKKLVRVDDDVAPIILKAIDPTARPLHAQDFFDGMPRGCIVAVVEVYGCMPAAEFKQKYPEWSRAEQHFGDFTDGRFCWLTRYPKILVPVPCCGAQGFFNLLADVEAQVKAQI